MKSLVFNLLLLSAVILNAQDKAPTLPRFSVRVSAGIPKIVSSTLLKHSFTSVIASEVSINCKLFSNFFVGIGYSYTYSKTTDSLSKHYPPIVPNMQTQNGFIKVGYDHFVRDNIFTTVSLNAGYGNTTYRGLSYYADSLKGKYPTQFNSPFLETQLGVYFLVDPNLAIGGHIGYNFNFSKFDIRYPALDKWLSNQSKYTNKWDMSSITLCFGFYYGIGKIK